MFSKMDLIFSLSLILLGFREGCGGAEIPNQMCLSVEFQHKELFVIVSISSEFQFLPFPHNM
jgi:hypothetical protein